MALKRAHVDAVIRTTGASSIFTQDVEDLPEYAAQTKPSGDVVVAATGEEVIVPKPKHGGKTDAPHPAKVLANPWLHKLEITNGEDGQPTWADGRGKYLCEVDLDTLKIVAQQFPHRLTPSDGVNLKAAFRTIKDKTHESLIERAYQEIADELPEVGTHSADAEGPAPEVE